MEKLNVLTFPDGSTYEIADAEARQKVSELLVEVDTLKEENNELNSKIAYVDATTPSSLQTNKEVSYPNGFNSSNCYVASVMTKVDDTRWDVVPPSYYLGGLLVSLLADNIRLYVQSNNSYLNKNIRVVLHKY